MSTTQTPYRNYTHPEKDEDLESSNEFFRINLFSIDSDMNTLFTTKANSSEVYLKTETYSQTETSELINSRISTYDQNLTWTTGDVRGNTTELNLRDDTLQAVEGQYSLLTVNAKGLVTTAESIIDDSNSTTSKTYSSSKIDTLISDVDGDGKYVLISDYSDSDILTKLKNVDGDGSELDSDFLDGEQGSFYLSWDNFTNTPTTLSGYNITDNISLNYTQTVASGATTTINFSDAENVQITLSEDTSISISNTTDLIEGQRGVIFISQDSTGGFTASFSSEFLFSGGTAPTLSTAANAKDKLSYVIHNSEIYCDFSPDYK